MTDDWEKRQEERERATEALLEALAKRGIKISIGACGCCNGPDVMVMIDDVVVYDYDFANMSSIEGKKP